MDELPSAIVIISFASAFAAVLLGYLSDRSLFNAGLLGAATLAACGLQWLGLRLGRWPGLVVAFLLVSFLAYRMGKGVGKQRGAVFVLGLWLFFYGSCAIGFWAGRKLGLLSITLPALIVFWLAMYYVSQHLLPIQGKGQHAKAFRSLVTFSLGTNYPFLAVEDRQLVERVYGYPYGQMFAGPGIVLTGPAHAPIVWEGTKFKRVGNPGIEFTSRFETIFQLVDLRPQLRSFHVEAITQEGIRVRILTFIPFKLKAAKQEPGLGESFPFDEGAVCKATWEQLVEKGLTHPWDETVEIMATRILRKIISQYSCDELCSALDPTRDPREEIRNELVKQLTTELADYGIEVLGGGISNLEPTDRSVIDERIQAWQAEWQRKTMAIMGKGQAEGLLEVERARAQANAGLFWAIRGVVEQQPRLSREALARMVALRFIETMEEIACSPNVQEELPNGTGETMAYLKRVVA